MKYMIMLAAGAMLASPAFAGMTIDGKPKLAFHAEGSPGFLTFDGKTTEMSVTDDGTTLTFQVPVDTLDSGIALRDQHMRETYVQTANHPHATLKLAKSAVTFPDSGSADGKIKGTFNIHGVDREVEVTYSIKNAKGVYKVKASFPFNTVEHGIEIPKYLGVTIKPDMTADVAVDLVDAS